MVGLFRIRAARSADAVGLAALERAIFTDAWPAGAFAAFGPGEFGLVAVDGDDAIAGFIVGRSVADEGEVLDLAVRVGSRRRGLGSRLLTAALDGLRLAGCLRVHLEVRASNTVAQAFYQRHGFISSGRRPGYYRKPPEDAVLMQREVTAVAGRA